MRRRAILGAAATLLLAPATLAQETSRPKVDLGALRAALADLARRGTVGDRKVLVTFDTRRSGVRLSQAVRRRHPELITIVLQHQFANLVVSRTGFAVDLWFAQKRERVAVPFAAITYVEDQAVEFEADI